MTDFLVWFGVSVGVGISCMLAWAGVEFFGDLRRREDRAFEAGWRAGHFDAMNERMNRILSDLDNDDETSSPDA